MECVEWPLKYLDTIKHMNVMKPTFQSSWVPPKMLKSKVFSESLLE